MAILYDSGYPYDCLYSYDGYYLGAKSGDPCYLLRAPRREYSLRAPRREYSLRVACGQSGQQGGAEMKIWPPMIPGEQRTALFDFAEELDGSTISGTPVVTVTLQAGTDPAPGAVLEGPPQVSATQVLQTINGGVDGARYVIQCKIVTDPGSEVIIAQALLPVRAYP